MEYAGALRLFPSFRRAHGRGFVVPEAVIEELAMRRVPPEIEAFLADGTARVGRRGGPRGRRTGRLIKRRGRGEADAIRIAGECEDRTFGRYVILTDDRDAQKISSALGMRSLDSLDFLLLANREGLLTAGEAMAALASLEASGYRARADARARLVRGLV